MLNKALNKEFENGLPNPIYYLWSDESSFLEEALTRTIETVISSNPLDFNYDAFYPSTDPQQILDAASTFPFMAQRRLVALRDFHQFPDSTISVLIPYFKEPSRDTCMIVLSQKAPKPVPDIKWKVYSLNIKDKDIPAWLKQVSARKEIHITDEAIEYLIEFVGYDIGLLVMEIEKLTLLGNKTIRGKDIISSTSMMRKYTSFDLIDALIAGQKSRAFRILKTILTGNLLDAPIILGTLNWHYRQFYTLWLNKGKRPVKMKEKTYRTLAKYLPSFNEDNFYHIFKSLHEADLGIKTSGKPALILEVLLLKLLQKGKGN